MTRSLAALAAIIGALAAALIAGGLLTYPLYQVASLLGEVRFHKIQGFTTIAAGLAAALLYLRLTGPLDRQALGFRDGARDLKRLLPRALAGGILVMLLLEVSLLAAGVHGPDQRHDLGFGAVGFYVFKSLAAGLAVALVEETLFRGALFSAVQRTGGVVSALVLTSALYAAVHYLRFPEPEHLSIDVIHWYTGVQMLPDAARRLADPAVIESLLTLFLLGWLFALMRLRRGNIIECIGFHAGIVAAAKVAGYTTDYIPGTELDFLVSKFDHQLGWLASAWLALALAGYWWLQRRGRPGTPG